MFFLVENIKQTQINGVVYANMDWCWIFFFPAIQLAVLATLNFFFTKDTPADAGFTPEMLAGEAKPLLGGSSSPPAPVTKAEVLLLYLPH